MKIKHKNLVNIYLNLINTNLILETKKLKFLQIFVNFLKFLFFLYSFKLLINFSTIILSFLILNILILSNFFEI